MADPQDPPRPSRPSPLDAEEETYLLAGEDATVEAAEDEDEVPPPEPSAKLPPAAQPLPRMWKATPDPASRPEPKPAPSPAAPKSAPRPSSGRAPSAPKAAPRPAVAGPARSKATPAPKGKPRDPDDRATERKGVLVEETPRFETVEARQTVRIIVGASILVVSLIVGFVLVRVLSPAGPDVATQANAIATSPAPPASPEQAEQEAANLFERARDIARNGKTDLAVSLLNRLVKSYPKTNAAAEAREALDRPSRNLPLFVDRPIVVATTPEKVQPAPIPEPVPPPMPTPEPTPAPADAHPARPLPIGFHAASGAGIHSSGWPLEIVCERDGAAMVLVPGGSFVMGRDDGEASERPAHRVTLSTYYIDRHEVTVRQFDAFQKEAGARTERAKVLGRDPNLAAPPEDAPVVMVTAREAKDYADWSRKRLPTEAQWELAARGTENRVFPWGSVPPRWSRKRDPRQIDPVRSFPEDVSPYGAFDMAGNACEWTKDWYDSKYYQTFRGQAVDDPIGPTKPRSLQLTVKGCSKTWEVSRREGIRFDTRLPFLGFRCALPVEGPDRVAHASDATANAPGAPTNPGSTATPEAPGASSAGGFVPF